jgi:hypothetical protein
MRTTTVRVELPVLARLILSEIAERRGRPDGEVLVDLIHSAAIAELEQPFSSTREQARSEDVRAPR